MKRIIAVVAAVGWMVLVSAGGAVGQTAGSFTDSRDGKKYRTVRIGNQTWMAENLNYQTGTSWCYGNKQSNCQKYGRLYDWNTAIRACPAGWRLPAREDWDVLCQAAGGERSLDDEGNIDWAGAGAKLKSITGWSDNANGTDEFGFSALPGGSRKSGEFDYAGVTGNWWSATEFGRHFAWYRYMYNSDVYESNYVYKSAGFSLRCVRDDGKAR